MTYLIATVLITIIFVYYFWLFALSRRTPALRGGGPRPTRIWIVVPALNEARVIRGTVESLTQACGSNGTVLVLDDGSDDGTNEILQELRGTPNLEFITRVAPNARVGKGRALNQAFRLICQRTAEEGHLPQDVIVGVMDGDGRTTKQTVDHILRMFEDPQVGAVQATIRVRNRHKLMLRLQDMEFVGFMVIPQLARERLGSVGLGGNGQFTRLLALQELGENPWTDCLTEDLEVGIRIAMNGWWIRCSKEAQVDQQGLMSPRRLIRQRTRWSQGYMQCIGLLPAIYRSRMATSSILDMTHTLLNPLLIAAGAVVFGLGYIWIGHSLYTNFSVWRNSAYPLAFLALYLLSMGPLLINAFLYKRYTREISWLSAFLLAHLGAFYNCFSYISTCRALFRQIFRRRSWAKTTRQDEDGLDAPSSQPPREQGLLPST